MANYQESSLLCLGCGEDIKDRRDDRRALQGSVEAERVVKAWRSMLEMLQCDAEERLCADSLISEDVSKEKMCRMCFSSFGRYFKLNSTLQEKLIKAVRSQVQNQAQESVSRKRPRLDKNVSYSHQAASLGESSQSPSVSVRYK